MILWGSNFSPFVRKVLVAAEEKGIDLELRQIALGARDPEFLAASPFGKMPALRDGDYVLADSSAIVAYLEAKHPEPALIPAEAQARGRVIWWDEFADTMLFECGKQLFFNRVVSPVFLRRPGDLARADAAERDELPPLLDYLERAMPDGGFLVGDGLTLADIAVASPFINLAHAGAPLDGERYPRLAAWLGPILARPSFARWAEKETRVLAKARGG